MFVDEVVIKVVAGAGGDGCTAFRREKFISMGGPYGGNGGKGSSIVFKVDEGLHTLLDLKYMKLIKGKKGENGKGKNQDGASAEDTVIKVPKGTVITDVDTNLIVADLTSHGDYFTVAEGGRGGRGNTAFKTQRNPAPNFSENGEQGEEKILKIELKLLADVGLVGFPSVGKSTIISKISNANPKIASYHFTTLSPNLGVVKTSNNNTFVVADLPGLIEGASNGIGLGDKFLKHIERTKLIAHVIDMSGSERNPLDDYKIINKELKNYSEKLAKKTQVIIANKMDLENSNENLKLFKKKIKLPIIEISASNNTGLEKMIDTFELELSKINDEPLYQEEEYLGHILYTFKNEDDIKIEKVNDYYVIKSSKVEKLFRMTKFNSEEGILRFAKQLRKMGIDEKLESMGAVAGDKVKILDYEFEYRN